MKLLKAGVGLNLIIIIMALLSIGLSIYTIFIGIAVILFIISVINTKKGQSSGRYLGIVASSIIIIVFIKALFNTLLSPFGIPFDLPGIMTIFAPVFYCFILVNLIIKK